MKNFIVKKYKLVLFILAISFAFVSCEDEITVPSQFEGPQLVIDAWLTNTNEQQVITLSQTVDYFNGGAPPTVENASITVCNVTADTCFEFLHTSAGRYAWTPTTGGTLGQVDDQFTLTLMVDDQIYTSTESLNRTAEIDSIGIEFEEESIAFEEGLYAQLYARDLEGQGDTYWIRAYKNDTLLNRALEIVPIYDATFDAGTSLDGVYFINPLRLGINALDEDGAFIPYQIGDRIHAEVHSINLTAFRFLTIAQEQIANEGIFTVPVANAPGNVINTNTGESILGIFNIAEVASIDRTIE